MRLHVTAGEIKHPLTQVHKQLCYLREGVTPKEERTLRAAQRRVVRCDRVTTLYQLVCEPDVLTVRTCWALGTPRPLATL